MLDLSRSNVYYLPRPASEADLALMRRIDELHLNFPFAGARMLRDMLKLEGFEVGRKHVRTLMDKMGIAAIYRKRNTSAPHPGASRSIRTCSEGPDDRPAESGVGNRYHLHPDEARLRLPGGHHGLGDPQGPGAPGVDQHDRGFLRRGARRGDRASTARRRSSTPTRAANSRATTFTDVLKAHDIQISMDGKGRWVDNVFVERLWKSVKYEHVYLHAYDSVLEAKQQLASYFEFYNTRRPHSSLGGQTPDTAYCGNGEWIQAA